MNLFSFNITEKFDRPTTTVSPTLPMDTNGATVLQPVPPTTSDDHDDGKMARAAIERVDTVY